MGLDMYICEDGRGDELAYWRKHPNLHGFIVRTFAGGVDECQRIYLTKENVEQVIQAVEANCLPYTTGFFFGESHDEQRGHTMEQLENIISMMNERPEIRVYYQASW
jgi:hypothetical protein